MSAIEYSVTSVAPESWLSRKLMPFPSAVALSTLSGRLMRTMTALPGPSTLTWSEAAASERTLERATLIFEFSTRTKKEYANRIMATINRNAVRIRYSNATWPRVSTKKNPELISLSIISPFVYYNPFRPGFGKKTGGKGFLGHLQAGLVYGGFG